MGNNEETDSVQKNEQANEQGKNQEERQQQEEQNKRTTESSAAGAGSADTNAPVDKKRLALVNGTCGQKGRVWVTGQVVDIPVTRSQKEEKWDPFLCIPLSQKKSIRPIQDFGMSGVRRPALQLEILEYRENVVSFEDLEEQKPIFTSRKFSGDDDSFFAYQIDEELDPGFYIVRLRLLGIESLRQSVSDLAYIGDSNSLILKKNNAIGYGRLRILDESYDSFVITSDIDQTFLNTRIESNRGLMATLFEEAMEKEPIIGMVELYRQIQRGPFGPMPLYFISASPHFFRRTFASLFTGHAIDFTGLNLKYLMNTVDSVIRKTLQTLTNFEDLFNQGFSRTMERTSKFLSTSLDNLFDHVSYKLTVLLENRLMQPKGVKEILVGDNTESDFFIFVIYQYLISGKIQGQVLEEYLYNLKFGGRDAVTRDVARKIRNLVDKNIELHGQTNSVAEIWINQANHEPGPERMRELINEALPAGFNLEQDGDIQGAKGCYGALGIGLESLDLGLIDKKQLLQVWETMESAEHEALFKKVLSGFNFKNIVPEELKTFLNLDF